MEFHDIITFQSLQGPALREYHPANNAALPDKSLEFLRELCETFRIRRVFEFGSGRSTKLFLDLGCFVSSLENSNFWMDDTLNSVPLDLRLRHKGFVRPLVPRFLGLFPVLDWKIDRDLQKEIENADLILIDSPYYTPYRESSLWQSLILGQDTIIVVDDTSIPTVSRFCKRIADHNPTIKHLNVAIGHDFDLFLRQGNVKLTLGHSVTDSFKGWYRFFHGIQFYRRLSK